MPWISLPETKAHLNKNLDSTADDTELQGFIDAACAMVEDLKGHVDLTAFTWTGHAEMFVDEHRRGYMWQWNRVRHVIPLPETPVQAVAAVLLLDGAGGSTAVTAADLEAGVSGWWLEDTVLHLPDRGGYEVTYTAGRDPVPANYRLAALELVAHLWKTTQMNARSPGPLGEPDTEWVRGMTTYAMPFRVRELLGLYGQTVSAGGGVVLA